MRKPHELLVVLSLAGCSSVGTVETDPPVHVLELASDYSILQDRGKAPITLLGTENLERYRFEKQGGRSEYLLVMFPTEASGPIKLKLATDARARATLDDGGYFDDIMRAQRLVLKGRFEDASLLINQIEEHFGQRFGTAVLGLTIALYKHDKLKFLDLLDTAKALAPDDDARAQLKGLSRE